MMSYCHHLISLFLFTETFLKELSAFPLYMLCSTSPAWTHHSQASSPQFHRDGSFQGHQWPLIAETKVKTKGESLILGNTNTYQQHLAQCISPSCLKHLFCRSSDLPLTSLCSFSVSFAVFSFALWLNFLGVQSSKLRSLYFPLWVLSSSLRNLNSMCMFMRLVLVFKLCILVFSCSNWHLFLVTL